MSHIRGLIKRAYRSFFRKNVCADCRDNLDRKLGLKARIRHRVKHARRKVSHAKHKLKQGIHFVTIRGKRRKVKVLANGRWRFMKG